MATECFNFAPNDTVSGGLTPGRGTSTFGSTTDDWSPDEPTQLSQLADGQVFFRYNITAGPNGGIVEVHSVTFTIHYEIDVSANDFSTDTFLTRATGLTAVAVGLGHAVIVGRDSRIYYTTDRGSNWNTATSPIQADYRDVIWDGRRYYASATGGIIISSADAINWSVVFNDRNSDFVDLALGRGRVVVAQSADLTLVGKPGPLETFSAIGATQ